jgi:hypothetical protein
MKTTFLTTRTNECEKYWESIRALGWGEVTRIIYDLPGTSDAVLYAQVKDDKPDFVVYIGSRWGQQPSISMLAKITNSVAPMIHFCSDAADVPWHDVLRLYHDAGAFTCQVAIDGNPNWPAAAANLTLLTPVDPVYFPAEIVPHSKRPTACGWGGNAGGENSNRSAILSELLRDKLVALRIRSNLPYTYEAFCDYLTTCRMALNIAYSGSEQVMHVKGRVVEAALAGCCLLENAGSPVSRWFQPSLDYIEYKDAADAARIINYMSEHPNVTEAMGSSLRKKVMANHSPLVFWTTILNKIGLPIPS